MSGDLRDFFRRRQALRAYRKRERSRDAKRFPTRWLSQAQLISLDVALLHEIEPDHVDERLLDSLVAGRDEAQKTIAAQSTIAWAVSSYLFLDYLNIDLPVSIAGFSLGSSPGVSELLMLLSAGLFLMGLSRLVSTFMLGEAIRACVRAIYPPESWHLHRLHLFPAEPPVVFPHPMTPYLGWERPGRIAAWFTIWMLAALILVLVIGFLASRGLIYSHIWASTEVWFGRPAVIVSATMDCLCLVYILIFVVPFPHRDWSLTDTLTLAEEYGRPGSHDALIEEHYGDSSRDRLAMIKAGLISSEDRTHSVR